MSKSSRHLSCSGKVAFPSEKLAQKAALSLGTYMRYYRCQQCGAWHLTGSRTTKPAVKKERKQETLSKFPSLAVALKKKGVK